MRKQFLVTGGAGFIGSNLVDAIIKNGHRCIIIDDLSSGYEKNIKINSSISFIKEKVQNTGINKIIDCDGIFHLAAQASVPYSIQNFFVSSKNTFAQDPFLLDTTILETIPPNKHEILLIFNNLNKIKKPIPLTEK